MLIEKKMINLSNLEISNEKQGEGIAIFHH